MAREFKTGFKVTGDSSGGVRASQAMRQELDQLNTTVDKQTKAGGLAHSSMGKYAVGLAGAATIAATAVVGMVRFTKAAAEQADRVLDLSAQIGTTTEWISALGYAAAQNGSSFEAATKSVIKMQKSITGLGDGLSTQVSAFGRLGIAYEDLKNLSPEAQFARVAEELGSMEDKTTRVATASAIFGKEGAALLPFFERYAEALAEASAEQDRFGSKISKEFAEQSSTFMDQLGRSSEFLSGIKIQIAEGLLPSLNALSQRFFDGVEATENWTKAGEYAGIAVRGMVATFITLKTVVELAAQAIWAASKVIVETLIALAAPVLEFGKSLEQSFKALISGDFAGAANAFQGLGERMATSFVDNISVVGLTLKDFGQDAAVKVAKAIEDVNDVMTRTATVSQGAGKSAAELAEELLAAQRAAEAAAKALQSLTDRLDPLSKLQRQFTVEQAILAGKIAEGGEGVTYYTQLLEILKEQYAAAARDAVGFGEKAAAAAEKAAERAAKAAEKEAADRAKALAKQTADVETFQKAFERGIERLDDLGADLWKNWITGAKSAMDSIKSFFQNWLAEMAHAAITRPILVSITAAMGLGGASAAMAGISGAAGGLGSLGGITGAAGGVSGLGGLAGIAGLFTGSGIGLGLQNLPTWLGGVSSGISSSGAPALFGNAAAYSNIAYGIAGILGGILGDKIFGGQGGVGGGIGSVIGLAAGGPLGAVLGGVVGGFLGGLIKSRPPLVEVSGTSNAGLSNSDYDATFSSGLGGGFLRSRRVDAATVGQFGKDLASFDDTIASFLDGDQIAAATAALKGFEVKMEGTAISMTDILSQRFALILGTFSDDIQSFVREVAGLEGQVQRLALSTTAQKIIDAAPDLFEGRTFREFIAVAEAMQGAGEDLTVTFQRLLDQVVTIANQLILVKGFADSDIAADYEALVSGQGLTLKDLTSKLATGIRELSASFTGSADDLATLAVLVSQRYDSEIAYLQQIDQILSGITSGFQGLKDQINRNLFGDEAFYDQITSQAEQLAAALQSMTDPAKIAATVAEIQRLTGIAYSLLDEEGKKTNAAGFLDFIEGVESDASEALQLARDLFVEESQVLRQLVEDMADSFADPLAIAATAHEDAAKALIDAGLTLGSAAADLGSVAGQMISVIRDGFRDIAGSTTRPAGDTISTTREQQGSLSTANAIVSRLERLESALVGAIHNTGSATVGAIHQNGSPNVIVHMPGPSAVLM